MARSAPASVRHASAPATATASVAAPVQRNWLRSSDVATAGRRRIAGTAARPTPPLTAAATNISSVMPRA
ncbi:MAG: hypothetical protein IPI34_08705 [bacterium]|nr:hypothetical protein [bacterium]